MIDIQINNTTNLVRNSITCLLDKTTKSASVVNTSLDYCFCQFECEQNLLVFAGANGRENDLFTLYFKSEDENATVKYFINDTEITDNTYGKTIQNGYIVDFGKVYSELGGGDYVLKIEIEQFGETQEIKYGKFKLAPFNIMRANGTVKIQANLNNRIENGFDFGNENVPFEIRIDGKFGNRQRVIEQVLNQLSSRNTEIAHKRWHYEYELNFDIQKFNFLKLIFETILAGEQIYITDYNLDTIGQEPYNKLPVIEIETNSDEYQGINSTTHTIRFEDALKNGIKRT